MSDGQGDAEVGNRGLAFRIQEDVAGFNVSVNHSVLVGVLQSRGHLLGDLERLLDTQLLFSIDLVAESVPLDVRRDEVEESVSFA